MVSSRVKLSNNKLTHTERESIDSTLKHSYPFVTLSIGYTHDP